jgi:hypothetical protein
MSWVCYHLLQEGLSDLASKGGSSSDGGSIGMRELLYVINVTKLFPAWEDWGKEMVNTFAAPEVRAPFCPFARPLILPPHSPPWG